MQSPEPKRGIAAPIVLTAVQVAELLGWQSADSFYRHRKALEAHGFPRKLPGINGWSRPAILRWVRTNGETHLPADLTPGDRAEGIGIRISGEARP